MYAYNYMLVCYKPFITSAKLTDMKCRILTELTHLRESITAAQDKKKNCSITQSIINGSLSTFLFPADHMPTKLCSVSEVYREPVKMQDGLIFLYPSRCAINIHYCQFNIVKSLKAKTRRNPKTMSNLDLYRLKKKKKKKLDHSH